jgi:hypothetical protein
MVDSKTIFAIWFYNGFFLKDKYKVLVNAQKEKQNPCDNGVLPLKHRLMN